MITNLTKEQESRFDEFVEKWTKIGLCTSPANRPLAEEGINKSYQIVGLEPPKKIIWCDSPVAQALTKVILEETLKKLTNENVKDNVGNSVKNIVLSSINNSVFNRVYRSVKDSVWSSICNNIWSSVENKFWGGVYNSVYRSIKDSVRSIKDSVWSSSSINDIWNSVRYSVRYSVLSSVSNSVWDSVWNNVFDSVWNNVFDSVWNNVLNSVWNNVWENVRNSVGNTVWNSVANESIYGQHEAGWLGFYDYFKTVLGLTQETQPLEGISQVAQNCGWWLPYQNICFASERPNLLKFNEQKQVHCDGGPAIQYPDGWSIWALNGVTVPQWLSETSANQLNPKDILKLENAQQRAEGVRKVGIERLLYSISPGPIDQKGYYELHVIDIGENNKGHYLKMQNPSVPELWHVEGVPSECNTVEKALNWRNGLSEDQIDDVNGADWYQQGDVIIRPKGFKKFKRNPIVLT